MRKFLFCIIILALAWLAKISYDLFQVSRQLPEVEASLHRTEQLNASLNDQVVALQRQISQIAVTTSTNPSQSPQQQSSPDVLAEFSPVALIGERLELVQFAVRQQQYVYALEKLSELDRDLHGYVLAPELKQSLHQVIHTDQLAIQQFVQAKTRQQESLDALLLETDQLLKQAIQQNNLSPAKIQPQHFWQRWLQIEPVQRPGAILMNRQLVLKEVQLRLLLVRQSLMQGQYAEYQQGLDDVIKQLNQLPDYDSQQLKKRLMNMKYLPVIPNPKLGAMTLLG